MIHLGLEIPLLLNLVYEYSMGPWKVSILNQNSILLLPAAGENIPKDQFIR